MTYETPRTAEEIAREICNVPSVAAEYKRVATFSYLVGAIAAAIEQAEKEATARMAKAIADLHRPFGIYRECGHDHDCDEPGVVDVVDVGLVCADGLLYTVCFECHTDDGEARENTDECKYPCATLDAISPRPAPALCGVVGHPESGRMVCEREPHEAGTYHQQSAVRWLGYERPAPEPDPHVCGCGSRHCDSPAPSPRTEGTEE
jgi:hypothetical protein